MIYDQIQKVIEYLESTGCKVDKFSDKLPDDVSGRTYYMEKEIHINCPNPLDALYTLLHEGGHWISYLRLHVQQAKKQPSVEEREKYAYLYGWTIIKKLNLPISKKEWKENC